MPIGRSFDFIEEFHRLKDRVRRLELRPQSQAGDGYVTTYSVSGDLTSSPSQGNLRWYPLADGNITLITASVGTPPSGDVCAVQVIHNGVVFDTVRINPGANYGELSLSSYNSFVKGDYFTIDIASTNGASDLVVELQVS